MIIDDNGFVAKQSGRVKKGKNWFLVKPIGNSQGVLMGENIHVSKELLGKRVRLKIEVLD